MLKKRLAVLVAAVLVLCVSGCKSTLGYSIELEKAQSKVYEVTLADLFNEEKGFYYDRISWGWSYLEIQNNCSYCLTKVYAYSDDGVIVYTAGNLHVSMYGRTNSDAMVGVTEDNKAYDVIFMFSSSDGVTPSQSELYQQLMTEAQSLYGDYTMETTENDTSGITVTEDTATWTYTAKDGSVSDLQIAKANMSFNEEPDYVSVAVIQVSDGTEAAQ